MIDQRQRSIGSRELPVLFLPLERLVYSTLFVLVDTEKWLSVSRSTWYRYVAVKTSYVNRFHYVKAKATLRQIFKLDFCFEDVT